MSGTVPIDQILNANPAWVRQDINDDLKPLIDSIRRNGLRVPVLLAPDFLVIDGARRVRAAQIVGLTEVPVVVTSDWTVILSNLTVARNPDDRTYKPMSWMEVHDLQSRILAPLYGPTRARRMIESKRAQRGRRRGSDGTTPRPQFVQEVATALGFTAPQFQALQDSVAAINKGASIDQGLGTQMRARLVEIERHEAKLFMANRAMREMLRRYMQHGTENMQADRRTAKEQEQTIQGIVGVLTHVKKEATEFTKTVAINPAVSPSVVADVIAELTRFRYDMRQFVQKLNAYLEESKTQGERTK